MPTTDDLARPRQLRERLRPTAFMILLDCDLHSLKQQVAVLDTDTGEVGEQELVHEGDSVWNASMRRCPAW